MNMFPVWLAMSLLPALGVIWLAQPRPAQAIGPVAFVSSQRISNETAEGKAGIARLQTMQRERRADARTKQQTLEATRTQLARRRVTNGYDDRRRSNSSEPSSNEAVAQAQADIQALQRQISTEITPKVKAAVEEIAKTIGVQVVLSGDNTVVWAAPGLDLTSRVIEQMNASATPPRPPG